ncbi:hypothetical protein EMGBD3_08840 [Nitrosarchaeum sp.]|nr:hypothetical protein EMGBD3_08840 [Nitrosarchaeum sp.]
MKNTITIVVVAAIIAIGAGFAGFGFTSNQSSPNQTALVTSALMSGHMQLVVTDPDGQIKAYRQTDNAITTKAENCVAKLLFKGPNSGTGNGCTGAITNPFAYIAVGTNSATETNTNVDLGAELTTSGLTRALGTVSIANSTSGGTGSTSSDVTITKAFSVSGTQTVTEAGLFNDTAATSTDSMFARKVFSGVTVNNQDTLTVTWTIKIGNSTSLN